MIKENENSQSLFCNKKGQMKRELYYIQCHSGHRSNKYKHNFIKSNWKNIPTLF